MPKYLLFASSVQGFLRGKYYEDDVSNGNDSVI